MAELLPVRNMTKKDPQMCSEEQLASSYVKSILFDPEPANLEFHLPEFVQDSLSDWCSLSTDSLKI